MVATGGSLARHDGEVDAVRWVSVGEATCVDVRRAARRLRERERP